MNKKTYLISGLMIIAFIVGIVGFNVFSKGGVAEQVQTQDPNVTIVERYADWGEIDIAGGKVEKEFELKNEGEGTLKLSEVVTSCACTTAQLLKEGEESPLFGMHSKSRYVMEVAPGETAKVKVVFDPAFHGPSGVGSISRQVFVETNDSKLSKLTLYLKANVVRN